MHVAFLVRKTNNDNSFAKQNTNPKPLVCIMGRVGLVLAFGGVTRQGGGWGEGVLGMADLALAWGI